MAAAVQHAAGGALLGAAASPAAAEFTWRAVAAAAPRLLRLMQQRHLSSSAPRAIHTLLHRPSLPSAAGGALRRPASASAATGASPPRLFHSHVHRHAGAFAGTKKQMPMMGSTAGSRHFSSQDNTKYKNQLQEEAKMKRKKTLAEVLMNDFPTSHPGAKDHGVEIRGISHLLSILDVSDTTAATASHTTVDDDAQVAELLSQVEKAKHALLIEVLGDGPNREQKKAELVDACRRLRDALAAHDERRALQNLYAEVKSLQQRVTTAEKQNKTLSDAVAAGGMGLQYANTTANSIRADVSRLGAEVKSMKKGTGKLEELVAQAREEALSAYGLSLFVGLTTVVGAFTALVLL